jgi:hypothetical protein
MRPRGGVPLDVPLLQEGRAEPRGPRLMFIPDELTAPERRMWEQLARDYDDKLLKRLLGLEPERPPADAFDYVRAFDTHRDPGDETAG